MKSANFTLVRYDADEGMVFDWVEEHSHTEIDEVTKQEKKIVEHLYARTLFLSLTDSIDNYV
ncbi:MAG: hypothetical protein MJZ55_00135, partial [Paludibacteraceae bacterium]|nr:hypothetical protein [Paludibacteraceae bacterium]